MTLAIMVVYVVLAIAVFFVLSFKINNYFQAIHGGASYGQAPCPRGHGLFAVRAVLYWPRNLAVEGLSLRRAEIILFRPLFAEVRLYS